MSKTYVLDANALLGLLVNGPGAERVDALTQGCSTDYTAAGFGGQLGRSLLYLLAAAR